MDENIEDLMEYGKMIEESLKSVVKKSLKKIQKEGLIGTHHFFITFNTTAKDVVISKALKAKYSQEMTIVLQHQFYDLQVEEDFFMVTLSFNGINETLKIPFSAITVFADPSVNFVLQFQQVNEKEAKEMLHKTQDQKETIKKEENQKPGDVVSLDFKKKTIKKKK